MKPYSPDRWNIYPETIPPEGIMMRAETPIQVGSTTFWDLGALIFLNGHWCNQQQQSLAEYEHLMNGTRFRPWEDKDGKES